MLELFELDWLSCLFGEIEHLLFPAKPLVVWWIPFSTKFHQERIPPNGFDAAFVDLNSKGLVKEYEKSTNKKDQAEEQGESTKGPSKNRCVDEFLLFFPTGQLGQRATGATGEGRWNLD